jgi:guanylate kinase
LDKPRFETLIAQGSFLEYAQVFDHFYGTSRHWVSEQLDQGRDVILEIDWQGARQVRAALPRAISIFILPPSYQALGQRLRRRGRDTEEIIERRMRDAVNEISHYAEYDYLLVNDDFASAFAGLQAIIQASRLKIEVQRRSLAPLLQALIA